MRAHWIYFAVAMVSTAVFIPRHLETGSTQIAAATAAALVALLLHVVLPLHGGYFATVMGGVRLRSIRPKIYWLFFTIPTFLLTLTGLLRGFA